MKAGAQPDDLKTQLKITKIQENRTIFPTEINHHKQPINLAVFNPSGLLFATCSNDGFVYVYNSVDYGLVNAFQICAQITAVKSIAWNKTGDQLLGATLDKVFVLDVYRFQDQQIIKLAQKSDFRIVDFKLSFGDSSLLIVSKFMFEASDLKEGQSLNDLCVYSLPTFMNALEPLRRKEAELQEFDKARGQQAQAASAEGDAGRPKTDHMVEMPPHDFKVTDPHSEFTTVAAYVDDSLVFVGHKKAAISRYNIRKSTTTPEKTLTLKSNVINRLEFSGHFEFLIASCNDSINLIDPETLEVIHSLNTKFPVLSGKITPLLYNAVPKYHLIFAGGIAAIDQARTSEGGNEIMIYNFATGKLLTKLSGCFGNVNYLDLFHDGSGFITAGQEGVARIYRFDMSYYRDKEFE